MSETTFGVIKVYEDIDYIGHLPWTMGETQEQTEERVRNYLGGRLFTKMTAKYHYTIVKTTISDTIQLKCPCNQQT